VAVPENKSPRRTQLARSTESAQSLIEATIELIAEQGFEKTTAAEIGERAGYSREMVRHRYGSKEQLLEWLLEHEHKTLLLRPPAGDRTGVAEALGQIDLMSEVAEKDSERLIAFLVLCYEAVGPIPSLIPWMRDWFASYQAQLATALRAGQRDGTIRSDLDPDTEAQDVTFYATGLCFSLTLHRDVPDFTAAVQRLRARLDAAWRPTPD
jgi:AcrR family transcriptional regulator